MKAESNFGKPSWIAFIFSLIAVFGVSVVVAATSIVHPANSQGWAFEVFPAIADLIPEFVDGPGVPPLGSGSYSVEIDQSNEKIILKRTGFHNERLDALEDLTYWTYADPTSTNNNNWYMNLYLDHDGTDGTDAYDVRLDYAPGVVAEGVWEEVDGLTGTWSANYRGGLTGTFTTGTIAQFLLEFPDAVFNSFNNSADFQIRYNMGDTATTYVGYVGAIDAIRINVVGVGDDTWDFELEAPPPPDEDDDNNDDNEDDAPPPPPQSTGPIQTYASGDAGAGTAGAITASGNPNVNVTALVVNGEGNFAAVGDPALISMGIVQAVDVFAYLPGGVLATVFDPPLTVCLQGTGTVYFRPASDQTGTFSPVPAFSAGGALCVTLSQPGLLVLVGTVTGAAPIAAAPASSGQSTPLTNCQVTTDFLLRLRAGASTSSAILDRLPMGTSLQATEAVNGWYRVIYGAQQGWVSADFVSTTGSCG